MNLQPIHSIKTSTEFVNYSSEKNNSKSKSDTILPNEQKSRVKLKVGVAATTLLGVASGMFAMMKIKKMPVKNPKQFFKNLVNIEYSEKNGFKHQIELLVGLLGLGSVTGGLIGGALFDKKDNMKAKFREALIQLVGNIATPLLCVSAGIRLFESHLEPKIVNGLKLQGKIAKLPKIAISAGILVGAIFAGNKIGNFLNEKLFNIKDDRKLKILDLSPHIDDVCLAVSIIASDSSKVISRFIPAALTIAGYSTGIAQEHKKS